MSLNRLSFCGAEQTLFRLTIGLMGLDELHLRVLSMASDDEKERQNAVKGLLSLLLVPL